MHHRSIRRGTPAVRPVRAANSLRSARTMWLLGLAGLAAAWSCGVPSQHEWKAAASAGPHATPVRTASGATAPADADPIARGLFVKNCAACHGEDGSGQGPTVLERPARNFKDGGFSFGNTPDAIFNTISHGIPGTPMPAFGEALREYELRQLASYVRTLGPAIEDVDEAETILTVTEESGPRIVRGILPPIVEGAPIRPRGLLLGLPGDAAANGVGGLTFEYRIDDVRLLGVRQGGFVARTDWGGRGGTPLKPLGGLIWTDGGGDPEAMFSVTPGFKATRQLVSSFENRIRSLLVTSDLLVLATLEDRLFPSRRGELSGFAISTEVEMRIHNFGWTLSVAISVPKDARLVESIEPPPGTEEPAASWHVFKRPDDVYECIGILVAEGELDGEPLLSDSSIVSSRSVGQRDSFGFPAKFRLVVHHLFSHGWTDTVRASLLNGAR
jgi:mono/diheme cytochrome c family protein